jgi:hypothetical protein
MPGSWLSWRMAASRPKWVAGFRRKSQGPTQNALLLQLAARGYWLLLVIRRGTEDRSPESRKQWAIGAAALYRCRPYLRIICACYATPSRALPHFFRKEGLALRQAGELHSASGTQLAGLSVQFGM